MKRNCEKCGDEIEVQEEFPLMKTFLMCPKCSPTATRKKEKSKKSGHEHTIELAKKIEEIIVNENLVDVTAALLWIIELIADKYGPHHVISAMEFTKNHILNKMLEKSEGLRRILNGRDDERYIG